MRRLYPYLCPYRDPYPYPYPALVHTQGFSSSVAQNRNAPYPYHEQEEETIVSLVLATDILLASENLLVVVVQETASAQQEEGVQAGKTREQSWFVTMPELSFTSLGSPPRTASNAELLSGVINPLSLVAIASR